MERNVKKINIGKCTLGSGKIYIQSMLKVPSNDIDGSVKQAIELERAGCDIIRAAIPDMKAIALIEAIKSAVSIPLVADIHLLLDNISPEFYTCDTADGRQKTKEHAFARLARIVCADINILSKSELLDIANYIYDRQLDQIREGLMHVLTVREKYDSSTPIVVTGLGCDFLAKKVVEQMGFQQIFDFKEELGYEDAIASPAVAIALLLAEKYRSL